MFRLCLLAGLDSALSLFSKSANVNIPADVSPHMTWDVTKEGLVLSRVDKQLRMNVQGAVTEPGAPLVLWHCEASSHELMYMIDSQIKLAANPSLCLNVEGGIKPGNRIITYPCGSRESGGLAPSEEFVFDNGFLRAKHKPEFCINIKGGQLRDGAELQLWKCQGGNDNELFHLDGSKIFLQKYPHLNLNVAGGEIGTHGKPLVLWSCDDAADHELFEFTADGRMRMMTRPDLCLNSEGGLHLGSKIILYPCHAEPQAAELFTYDQSSGLIIATQDPQFGLNAAGGQVKAGDSVVLWPINEKRQSVIEIPTIVSPHMTWDATDAGLVMSRADNSLRINVQNGATEPGAGLVLWHCEAKAHEQLFLTDTQIKLAANPSLCLNAEGGVQPGNRIITFPCGSREQGGLAPTEEFIFDNGLIRAKDRPSLCINIKGSELREGGEIQLWHCNGGDDNEMFHLDGNKIFLQKYPHLNMNVAGGEIGTHGKPLVLWTCDGAADHELFEFTSDGRMRMKTRPDLCLNSEGGLNVGNRIILYSCHTEPQAVELFTYDPTSGLIIATSNPELGFNAAGGKVKAGDSVVLWPINERRDLVGRDFYL